MPLVDEDDSRDISDTTMKVQEVLQADKDLDHVFLTLVTELQNYI